MRAVDSATVVEAEWNGTRNSTWTGNATGMGSNTTSAINVADALPADPPPTGSVGVVCTGDEHDHLQPAEACGGSNVGFACDSSGSSSSCGIKVLNPFVPRAMLLDYIEERFDRFARDDFIVTQSTLMFVDSIDVSDVLGGSWDVVHVTVGVPLMRSSALEALDNVPLSIDIAGDRVSATTAHSGAAGARLPLTGSLEGVATLSVSLPFIGRVSQSMSVYAHVAIEVDIHATCILPDIMIVERGQPMHFGGALREVSVEMQTELDFDTLEIGSMELRVPNSTSPLPGSQIFGNVVVGALNLPAFRDLLGRAVQVQVDAVLPDLRDWIADELLKRVHGTTVHLPGAADACAVFGPCVGRLGAVVDRFSSTAVMLVCAWAVAAAGWLISPLCCCILFPRCRRLLPSRARRRFSSTFDATNTCPPGAGTSYPEGISLEEQVGRGDHKEAICHFQASDTAITQLNTAAV